jgi:hypothetical protein
LIHETITDTSLFAMFVFTYNCVRQEKLRRGEYIDSKPHQA